MKCPTPISIPDPKANHKSVRITVPCSKCGACRHNRRIQWSFRLKQELQSAVSAFFVTITYDDDHVPKIGEKMSLKRSDLQKFHKLVRKENALHTDNRVRYYAVGEYGTNTERPHYHILYFNLHDKTVLKLDKLWKKGFYHVGQVTDNSIHYVAKYHVNSKKREDGREEEFATMSTRPGIGLNYVKKNFKWHKENQYFHVVNNGYKQAIPRYYKEKIFTEYEKEKYAREVKIQQDIKYLKEVKRLKILRVKEPEINIFLTEIKQARKVKDKKSDKDLF